MSEVYSYNRCHPTIGQIFITYNTLSFRPVPKSGRLGDVGLSMSGGGLDAGGGGYGGGGPRLCGGDRGGVDDFEVGGGCEGSGEDTKIGIPIIVRPVSIGVGMLSSEFIPSPLAERCISISICVIKNKSSSGQNYQ